MGEVLVKRKHGEIQPCPVAHPLSVTGMLHRPSRLMFERDLSDKSPRNAVQNTFEGWSLLLLLKVRVHGPRHNIQEPTSEGIALLHFRAPGWRVAHISSLPIAQIVHLTGMRSCLLCWSP